MAYPKQPKSSRTPSVSPRPEATCQQQITRLPVYRPGDFVIAGGCINRVETLTCWVTPGDEIGNWLVSFVDGDPMPYQVIERYATADEIEDAGPWEPLPDYSYLKATLTMALASMAAKGDVLTLGGLWTDKKAHYVEMLREELQRMGEPVVEPNRWNRLELNR